MKNAILAAALVLLTANVGQAQGAHDQLYEFKAYSWGNYGSPFYYFPVTGEDLNNALAGNSFNTSDGGMATLAGLFENGQTSFSDDYDVGGGFRVKYSGEGVHHPPEPLSTAAPGIGARASASATNTTTVGAATIIGESYVYLKETLSVQNLTGRDHLLDSFKITFKLDGFANVSGDAIVQVGMATRMTADATDLGGDPLLYGRAQMQTLQESTGPFGTPINTYNFGQPIPFSDPAISLEAIGPYGTEVMAFGIRELTVESLLYVRAQVGSLRRGAGAAAADFSNTMQVANIEFFDQDGQVIPGLQVVGAKGNFYPYNAVPEPSALAIVGVGCSGLMLARSRRVAM